MLQIHPDATSNVTVEHIGRFNLTTLPDLLRTSRGEGVTELTDTIEGAAEKVPRRKEKMMSRSIAVVNRSPE